MSLPPVPAGLAPLPDAEAVVAALLAGRPELAGIWVGDRLPDTYDGSQLAVLVDRIGGAADPSTMSWFDTPHLDLKSYGKDKAAAQALSAIVRYLMSIAVYCEVQGAVFSDVVENTGPQWFADASADYPESGYYLLQVAVTLHPVS